MTLSLPEEKCNRVISKCDKTVNSSQITIRELAELIGTLIAAAPATKYGKVSLSVEAKSDLSWWILNAGKFYNNLHKPKPQCIITTDASPTGWGAWIEADGKEIHGHWSGEFLDYHINVLEIWAVFLGLRFLIKTRGIHILVRTDSSTAMAYINKFGGCRSTGVHDVAKKLWRWAESHDITIAANYINTKDNYVADKLSRKQNDSSDFMLSTFYFDRICREFGVPEIDLFASHGTTQCKRFYSYKPDPTSEGIDAFSFTWVEHFYAFPPFNLVNRVINKIIEDKSEGIVVLQRTTSAQPQVIINGRDLIREAMQKLNLPENVLDILRASKAEGTWKQYESALGKCLVHNSRNGSVLLGEKVGKVAGSSSVCFHSLDGQQLDGKQLDGQQLALLALGLRNPVVSKSSVSTFTQIYTHVSSN
ncbi:Enzymatic polyprotein [Folsomia candida]|uniref:Enzymatic polyprotein n=1 Tax=Folsomia candida TaxID=158441 RepID=A0A226EGB2_FOLCA|nr:Enzymatic polyprotein [Folsomia candida]